MDARLDTLSKELYQMNVRVDDGDDDDALDDDGDVSSTDEMSTLLSTLCHS